MVIMLRGWLQRHTVTDVHLLIPSLSAELKISPLMDTFWQHIWDINHSRIYIAVYRTARGDVHICSAFD